MKRKYMYKIILSMVLSLFIFQTAYGSEPLLLDNKSTNEILNIFVDPENKDLSGFFLRLDLAPGKDEQVENPECTATLRIDSGLDLSRFENVPLTNAKRINILNNSEIEVIEINGKRQIITGNVMPLLPQKGSKPVCELGKFHPGMPMKDVCSILEQDLPKDDNGAILTGLGFAGMVWAGRLEPERTKMLSASTPLEHLELRRPLNREEVLHILEKLYQQGYSPWQAEFPDNDIDFGSGEKARNSLLSLINSYLNGYNEKEATILLAPLSILPALENSDVPDSDVQLFTITLKPSSDILLIDITAYQGGK